MQKELLTSKSSEWETPKDLFNYLDKRFSFTLDPCSTEDNHLCPTYFTKETNGLTASWKGHRVFMNPPYGKDISLWVQKACDESYHNDAFVVGLLPARTDTNWWKTYVEGTANIIFLRGRLKFSNSKNSAPFPSAIVLWYGKNCLEWRFYED